MRVVLATSGSGRSGRLIDPATTKHQWIQYPIADIRGVPFDINILQL